MEHSLAAVHKWGLGYSHYKWMRGKNRIVFFTSQKFIIPQVTNFQNPINRGTNLPKMGTYIYFFSILSQLSGTQNVDPKNC